MKIIKYCIFKALILYYKIEFFILLGIPFRKEKSILIMRLDAIGDMIIWFDAAKEYRKYFPNTHLVLVCNKVSKEIAEALPYFDEVICLDTKKFLKSIPYRLKYLAKLKRRKFEKAINPVFSRDFFIQDTLIHNIRAEKKIGYQGNYLNTESTLLGLGKYFIKYANTLKSEIR